MPAQVKLFLLGPFRAERAGAPLTDFKSDKVRALLAYLAVERDTVHHRDVLANILWPESPNALALLRDVLSNLRTVLGDRDAATPILQVERTTLQINPAAGDGAALWLDAAAFSQAVEAASSAAELEQAVSLYRGDFLEGFALADAPDFEVWAMLQREALQRKALEGLYRLTTHHLQHGDYAAAQASARRQLTLEPYSEDANRQLMRALAFAGQRNEALAHYDDYRGLLDEKLGVAPDIRTTALYQRIRDRKLPAAAPSSHSPLSLPTPCVGRASELAWLETRLQQAQAGKGQVVFVSGEAGSGKTTLVRAFAHRVLGRADDVLFAGGACNAQIGAGDPYLPFREILRLLVGNFDAPAAGGALAPLVTQRLEAFAPAFVELLGEEGPGLIGRLVPAHSELIVHSLGEPVDAGRATLPPAAVCDQVTRVLRAAAQRRVLVLMLDDLQWADGGTLNLLAHLGRRLAGSRILLIGIYRSPMVAPDHALLSVVRELQGAHGDIALDLDQAGGRAFVDAVLDSAPNALDDAFRTRLTQQTGGHALFTTALVEQMRDDGALVQDDEGRWRTRADLDWSRVPPRVEAVIARRLARLTESQREVLMAASVEGVVFTAEVTARVLGRNQEDVERVLHALGDNALRGPHHRLIQALGLKRIRDQRASPPRSLARYRFRHALFQQYLTTRLDPVQRKRLHEATAHVLETLYAGDRDATAAQLAYHFEAAGLVEPAVDYLLQAGQRAYRLSAPAESTALYQRGLALLKELPASERRDRREMEILLHLEEALMTSHGWGAPERAESLDRAYQLGKRLGEMGRLLPVLRALASVHIARAEHRVALDTAKRLLTLAEETENDLYVGIGKRMMGTGHFFLGHYAQARDELASVLNAYRAFAPTQAAERALMAEERIRLRVWLSNVLLAMGFLEQAAVMSQEALARADALDYVGVQGIALTTAGAVFHAACRQPQAALHYAKELLALSTKHVVPSYRGWAYFYQGWAMAYQGQPAPGLVKMRAGLEQLEATGTQGSLPHLFTLMAEVYAETEEIGAGWRAVNRALTLAEETGARSYLAEMHRVQGGLHLKEQAGEKAEASFERAIGVAQEQAARLWELRATTDLARLWRVQGNAAEVHARLRKVYTWFTEGLELPDLVEARNLLKSSKTLG